MFDTTTDFTAYQQNKTQYYQSLSAQLEGLLSICDDPVTNMSQTAAFIYHSIPELNWAGFYRASESNLRLGPFQGKVACVDIPFGRGVCGTVAASATSILVNDVHSFDGHIACDSASNSEIVVPIFAQSGAFYGVLDIDSPTKNRFSEEDLNGFELLVATFVKATKF